MTLKKNGANGRSKSSVSVIAEALNQAALDAVEAHRRAGQPLVVWKNGRTVLVSPQSVESVAGRGRRRRKSRPAAEDASGRGG